MGRMPSLWYLDYVVYVTAFLTVLLLDSIFMFPSQTRKLSLTDNYLENRSSGLRSMYGIVPVCRSNPQHK